MLYYGLFGLSVTNLFLTEEIFHHFCNYSFGYALDPYVILSPAGGCLPVYRYLVQPLGEGSTGFIQPVRLAV
jgi:hypothetical protein